MVGNLKSFGGFDSAGIHKLDHYAHFLREIGHQMFGHGGFLWIARIGLLVAFVLHIVTVIQLKLLNKKARGTGYRVKKSKASTLGSKFMFWGGLCLLVFVIVHLLHLTFGNFVDGFTCLLYTSPSPRDATLSRMPSSA